MKRFLSLVLLTSILFPSAAALAETDSRGFEIDTGFNPNAILSDVDIFSTNGMSFAQLVSFLRAKGKIADIKMTDIDGVERTGAEIIWRMANMYQINPKYLLALLQKEQSLVEDSDPTERQLSWAAGFGVCDSCSKDDPSIQDFKGFANQMYYAARQMREKYYLRLLTDGQTLSGYALGRTVNIDGVSVTPANFATAALYTYTPHIHGNLNLWRIWQRWFTKSIPEGSLVRGIPSNTYYWIRYGEKRPFVSGAVASSMKNIDLAMEISDSELAGYTTGKEIKFSNYSLLKDEKGRIWLLVGDERRQINDMETFRKLGFIEDEVETVQETDLFSYDIGDRISLETKYLQGRLVQVSGLKAVWYAENGKKHLLNHPALLSLYFSKQKPQQISQDALDSLAEAEPYTMQDGELVKSNISPAVYVIEQGAKRPIPSGDVFESMGWKWKNVKTVPEDLLASYTEGSSISTDASTVEIATQ